MQKIKFILAATFLLTMLTTACKYEDGPGISFRAKRDRVANEWLVDQFIYDGKNITDSINSREDTFSVILEMTRTGSYSIEWVRYTVDPNNGTKYYGTSHATNNNLNNSGPALWNPKNIANYSRKMPLPLKALGPRGEWSFNKKHTKLIIGPETSYVPNGYDDDTNPLFWTITKLKEKNMGVKGIDASGKSWSMQLKHLNGEPYWL